MTQFHNPYSAIEEAIAKLNSTLYPSEVHGTLCGLLCISNSSSAQSWLDSTFKGRVAENLLHTEAMAILTTLLQDTLQQINDVAFEFHLLLPDDDAELETRLECLGADSKYLAR